MKRKILIACASFYPVISPRSHRATELAKAFAKEWHDVTVLTIKDKQGYDEFAEKHNLKIKDFGREKFSFDSFRKRNNKGLHRKIIRKTLSYLFLWPLIKITPLLYQALMKEHGYNMLISIAVPYTTHWGVALAMKSNNSIAKVWIADCGDPFTGNKEKKIGFPFYFKWIEKWFCKKPDFITVPIKESINAYPAVCQHKIRVIPQGFDFSDLPEKQTNNTNSFPVFAYAGKFNETRDPRPFLNYLIEQDKEFVFIVYTNSKKYMEGYIDKLGTKLIIRNYIPREQLLYELSAVDFVINFENIGGVQVPSKLIDYALINKPILSLKPNDINEQKIKAFLEGDYSQTREVGDISQYDIKNIIKQFLELEKEKNKFNHTSGLYKAS